jgi:hypothetical protein
LEWEACAKECCWEWCVCFFLNEGGSTWGECVCGIGRELRGSPRISLLFTNLRNNYKDGPFIFSPYSFTKRGAYSINLFFY